MEYYRKTFGMLDDKTLDRLFKAAISSPFTETLKDTKDIDLHTFDLLYAAFKSLTPSVIVAGMKSMPLLSLRFMQQFR